MAHDLSHIEQLLRDGAYEEARAALATLPSDDPALNLLRLELSLYAEESPAALIQQRLIELMRRNPDLPRSREVYQEASRRAYEQQSSSAAHSHPPPTRRR